MKSWAINITLFLLGIVALQIVPQSGWASMHSIDSSTRASDTPAASSLPGTLKPGMKIDVKNWTLVNSGKAKPGKKVSARVFEDVVVNGQVIVPRKSVLAGHVFEVQKKDKTHPESRLRIVFDSIKLRGRKVAFTGVIELVWRVDDEFLKYEHCNGEIELCNSTVPSPKDEIGSAHPVSDDPDQGIVIISRRNISLGWQTRFTVRVVPALTVVK